MGYSTSSKLVEQNVEILEAIRSAVERGETLRLRPDGNVSTEQYRLRRILASCDRHPEALRGEFLGLGEKVRLRVSGDVLLVEPKGKFRFEKRLPSIEEEIRRLSSYSGKIDLLTFEEEGVNWDLLKERLNSLGWILHPHRQRNEDGTVSVAVERRAPKTGFNAFLDKIG